MIFWLNGSFGAGKTTVAYELCRRLEGAFVYDPENMGYFLRSNLPRVCMPPDFQDIPLWRQFNRETLKWMAGHYPGPILVPMTINEGAYYEEILGYLAEEGVPARHLILQAGRETLLKRLKGRSLGRLSKEEFGVRAIEKSLAFFATRPEGEKVDTDGLTVDQVVEQVARRWGLTLKEDSRSGLKKRLDRARTTLGHIRGPFS